MIDYHEAPQGLTREMIKKIKRMRMKKSRKECSICCKNFKTGFFKTKLMINLTFFL